MIAKGVPLVSTEEKWRAEWVLQSKAITDRVPGDM